MKEIKINSNGDKIYREKRNCKEGEVNKCTREYWCNAYNEFCKFIGDCAEKTARK